MIKAGGSYLFHSQKAILIVCWVLFLQGCGLGSAEDLVSENSSSAVGASSNAYLTDRPYRQLIIEFAYVDGNPPLQESIESLVSFLRVHLNKPDGIRIVMDPPLPRTLHSPLTLDDIRFMEKNYRMHYSDEETAAAFFLILDQSYYVDSARMQTFGLAFNSSAMAIFEPPIDEMISSNPVLSHQALESTIFMHEFGHLLGLVNMGAPMVRDHLDRLHENRGHCNNPRCLMYFAVNTTLSVTNSGARSFQTPSLDENCLRDIRSAGGR